MMVMRFLLALAFAAPMFSQSSCFVVSPLIFNIGAAGQTTGTVHVTQAPGSTCSSYTASTQTPWLTITSGPSGVPGDAGVAFIADANLSASPRVGYLTVALQTVTVNQAGANCTFTLSPTSRNFPVGGGSDTFKVSANCAWLGTVNADDSKWITVNANNGISDVPVSYSAAANACAYGRSGAITVKTGLANPPALAITEDGSPANISLSAYSVTVPAPASDGRVTVATGDGCNWTATTDVSWIQITFGSSGAGGGGISYHLLENTLAQRTGSIKVGDLKYTITQLAPAAPPVVLKSVTNAANYNSDAVSPGEIVALFGDNMGPAAIVTLQVVDGVVTNSLAGTQVLFDGVAAPLIYTRKDQVSAVVPYGVAGKTSTKVQVRYQGADSNAVTMPVRATTPAIFSQDSTGVGPGAILNQDLTINSSGNPAAPGSVIALYCTGGGVTKPPSSDGAVIPDASFVLAQTPVVTIGGVNAAVKYAGAAPYSVAGVIQINVEVPTGVAPAIGLPVIVKIGDYSSTGSVTVAVR